MKVTIALASMLGSTYLALMQRSKLIIDNINQSSIGEEVERAEKTPFGNDQRKTYFLLIKFG